MIARMMKKSTPQNDDFQGSHLCKIIKKESKRSKTDVTAEELGNFFLTATSQDLKALYEKIINLPDDQVRDPARRFI